MRIQPKLIVKATTTYLSADINVYKQAAASLGPLQASLKLSERFQYKMLTVKSFKSLLNCATKI